MSLSPRITLVKFGPEEPSRKMFTLGGHDFLANIRREVCASVSNELLISYGKVHLDVISGLRYFSEGRSTPPVMLASVSEGRV